MIIMMKKFLFLFLASATLSSFGQVADQTVTDCNSNSRSIYAVLASGKPLVIASKGFDCSNCKSTAAALQSWASQNSASVEVWGAMTFTYSSSTPTCSNVSSWVSTYSWNDIFSYLDANRFWFKFGTPRYYVYDPADSTIAYEGPSQSIALSTALTLVPSNIGQTEVEAPLFSVSSGEVGKINLYDLPQGETMVQIVSLTGVVVQEINFSSPTAYEEVSLDKYSTGIYLVNVQNKSGFQSVKKVYLR